jgi:hypothetical protein
LKASDKVVLSNGPWQERGQAPIKATIDQILYVIMMSFAHIMMQTHFAATRIMASELHWCKPGLRTECVFLHPIKCARLAGIMNVIESFALKRADSKFFLIVPAAKFFVTRKSGRQHLAIQLNDCECSLHSKFFLQVKVSQKEKKCIFFFVLPIDFGTSTL